LNDIGRITFTYMQNNINEDCCALSIEVWCTLIEEEITLKEDKNSVHKSFNIIDNVSL